MRKKKLWFISCAILVGCSGADAPSVSHRAAAEGFFEAVYGCDATSIDDYGAEGVVVSYPIFETLYQTPAIRGREAVRDFSSSFCRRWSDPQITVNQAIEEGDRVVLLWSFSAVDNMALTQPGGDARARDSWGGISAFRVDDQGKVVEEVGEESSPGPIARLGGGGQ